MLQIKNQLKRYKGWDPEWRHLCFCNVWAQPDGIKKSSVSPAWKLSETPPFTVLFKASLHRHEWLFHWLSSMDSTSNPFLPGGEEHSRGPDSSNPLIRWLLPPLTPTLSLGDLESFQNHFIDVRNSKGLRVLFQEWGLWLNVYLINHSFHNHELKITLDWKVDFSTVFL